MADIENQLEIRITRSIERTLAELSAWILSMQDLGMSDDVIKGLVETDLATGGRIFGEYKNAIKTDVSYGVNSAAIFAMQDEYKKSGVEKFQWQLEDVGNIPSGKNCPDCESRADEIGTLDFWESVGLPQSGFSVCRDNCYCKLVPIK